MTVSPTGVSQCAHYHCWPVDLLWTQLLWLHYCDYLFIQEKTWTLLQVRQVYINLSSIWKFHGCERTSSDFSGPLKSVSLCSATGVRSLKSSKLCLIVCIFETASLELSLPYDQEQCKVTDSSADGQETADVQTRKHADKVRERIKAPHHVHGYSLTQSLWQ